MTAGRGIVHSERAGDDLHQDSTLHGIQSWMALPENAQEIAPEFTHYPAGDIPEVTVDGVLVRVIIGEAFGHTSPVKQYSPTLYFESQLPSGRNLSLPSDSEELAFYVVSGCVEINDDSYSEGTMAVVCKGSRLRISAQIDSRVMIIGGAPIGHRELWWKFVSSCKERIELAKADWANGRFDKVQGDDEFIPLPH